MLIELSIRNLAVIESVQAAFARGFHVLTGETGAGKSILIDALSLIIGGRGSSELVRYGCDKSEMEALFDIPADQPVWGVLERLGIEANKDEHIVIKREITAQGKSTSRVNGQLVNLSMLREIGEWLVNIHGQHEHQSLLKVDQHLHWLDLYGELYISEVKNTYAASFRRYSQLMKELREFEKSSKQTLQMMDLYRFQKDEISAAGLKSGEDELLLSEKRKLANAEKMLQTISGAYEAIYGSKGVDAIGKSMHRMEEVVPFDQPVLQPLLEQIQAAYYQLEDAAFQLRDYRELIEFNPDRLEQIEDRLNVISSFRRKYGENVTEILSYYEEIMHNLQKLESKDDEINKLQEAADIELKQLVQFAAELSQRRQHTAHKLASSIETELSDLHMERTRFEVHIERSDDHQKLTIDGWDQVEFLISANPGEPVRPLNKIASGGELSRIMLALKSIFARVDRIPVLVFDEVDTGVSGRAAQAIAEKLARLSSQCQVFSITHLAQVACMADAHYEIRKELDQDRTFTKVIHLTEQGRIHELARMLGGVEVTRKTLDHAKEMLILASEKKSGF